MWNLQTIVEALYRHGRKCFYMNIPIWPIFWMQLHACSLIKKLDLGPLGHLSTVYRGFARLIILFARLKLCEMIKGYTLIDVRQGLPFLTTNRRCMKLPILIISQRFEIIIFIIKGWSWPVLSQ